MNHLVIFGERPGPNTDSWRPLHIHSSTGAANRLRLLLDMSVGEYYETSRYNVVDNSYGKTTSAEARKRVLQRMMKHQTAVPHTKFLFLGRAAAEGGPPPIRTLEWGQEFRNCMVIPHPSGRNRYYNSAASTHFIKESLRKFLGRKPSTIEV